MPAAGRNPKPSGRESHDSSILRVDCNAPAMRNPSTMRAYLLRTGRVIEPLGDSVANVRVHNVPLRDLQVGHLRAVGCDVEVVDGIDDIREFPCFVVHDDLFFTYHALARFVGQIKQSDQAGHDAGPTARQAALDVSPLTESFTTALQGPRVQRSTGQDQRVYDMYHLTRRPIGGAIGEVAEPLTIPCRYRRIRSRVNKHFEPSGRFTVPLSTVFMHPVRHWAALPTVNLVGIASHLLRAVRRQPFRALAAGMISPLRAGSLRPRSMLTKLYLRGRGCRIHPTAHIENSILGDRVRVGAGAVVRNSRLADKVEIGAGATVDACALDIAAQVGANASLRAIVVGEEAGVSTYVSQLTVIGRGANLCPGSWALDFNFNGTVPIRYENRTIESGSRILGTCIGPGAFLGPRVTVAAGREIPPGAILIQNPADIVCRMDREMPHTVVRIDTPHGGIHDAAPLSAPMSVSAKPAAPRSDERRAAS